ncbi:unnamed protein product [Darwinula stevensoni]|uniref:Metallo-beta-lactamase domain-containing protein n=1 Tax=Darwinula stevensoni TaxID=69355 RepID=A0A7R8X6V4_9CRUS|nr:unnamed protein product [Darwinula stevensoni]CAG0887253.1 unnamed protein product [Darwinula stevensoni]
MVASVPPGPGPVLRRSASPIVTSLLQTRPFGTSPIFEMFFRQLFDRESCTYTYVLADPETKEAIIIDPVIQMAERDAQLVKDLGLTLKYACKSSDDYPILNHISIQSFSGEIPARIRVSTTDLDLETFLSPGIVNTHVHADHITGTGKLKHLLPGTQSVLAEASRGQADVKVKAGDEIRFGKYKLQVRATPGHTNGCLTYVSHDKEMAFTGDALLVRGCGRTDFQDIVFVRYGIMIRACTFWFVGQTATTVSEEKKYNPRLTKTKEEFIEIMNNLNLAYPKMIGKDMYVLPVCIKTFFNQTTLTFPQGHL